MVSTIEVARCIRLDASTYSGDHECDVDASRWDPLDTLSHLARGNRDSVLTLLSIDIAFSGLAKVPTRYGYSHVAGHGIDRSAHVVQEQGVKTVSPGYMYIVHNGEVGGAKATNFGMVGKGRVLIHVATEAPFNGGTVLETKESQIDPPIPPLPPPPKKAPQQNPRKHIA